MSPRDTYFPRRVVFEQYGLREGEGISIRLSERARQVIGPTAEGLSNQEIAERLFITQRTVRFHISSIFNKLGANNRAQVVAIADRMGTLQYQTLVLY